MKYDFLYGFQRDYHSQSKNPQNYFGIGSCSLPFLEWDLCSQLISINAIFLIFINNESQNLCPAEQLNYNNNSLECIYFQ